MAQFSVKIMRLPGSVLGENQHSMAYLAPEVLEKLLIHRIPPALSLNDLISVAELPWAEQMEAVFGPA